MTISSAFSPSRVARGVAIQTFYKQLEVKAARYRPTRFVIVGPTQSDKSVTDRLEVNSLSDVADYVGYKNPIYQTALMVIPQFALGAGTIPVTIAPIQPSAGQVAEVRTITPTVSGGATTKVETYTITVNNLFSVSFTTEVGDAVADVCDKAVAAVQSILDMPVVAADATTNFTLTAGFYGAGGGFLDIDISGPTGAEVTFAEVVTTPGAGTFDITDGLNFGDYWDSHVINCLSDYSDATTLNSLAAYNVSRAGFDQASAEIHKPFVAFTGSNDSEALTTAVTDARATDYTNCIVPSYETNDLPWMTAGRIALYAGLQAESDPATDTALAPVDLITVPEPQNLWNRQAAVTKGCSTAEIRDGIYRISNLITCYHPAGEEPPAYRNVSTLQKISTAIYELGLIFDNPGLAGRPLVPDEQATTNANAYKPKMGRQALANLAQNLANAAIISDPEYTVENSDVQINGANPDRLDVRFVYKVSGNVIVVSVDNVHSFYFGG